MVKVNQNKFPQATPSAVNGYKVLVKLSLSLTVSICKSLSLSKICPCVKNGLTVLCYLTFFSDVNSHNKVVVCYVAGWSAYRPTNGAFTVENIDPMLCTHIIYAFAGLDNVTYSINSLDSFLDTEEGGGRGNIHSFQL